LREILIRCREEIDDQLSNNVLSVHQVTRKFLPLLKKGEQKKVINMFVPHSALLVAPNTFPVPQNLDPLPEQAITHPSPSRHTKLPKLHLML
jgi:NAD(P)-dependent dehydrogenase (short-subunit alcohol dehydrogenase family)